MISAVDIEPSGAERDLVAQVSDIFSEKGLLSGARNFEYRPEQQQMAVAVAKALHQGDHLVVEAGTGVGKSLAYLVPSILYAVAHKKKAVISTHTINLQEQLTEKDLPMLEKALPEPFKYTMLKGRSNYLCVRRLEKAMQQAESLFTSPESEELKRIFEWSKQTGDGSLSDFEILPDPKVWQQVCSERGLCSPKLCGHKSDYALDNRICFFQRARSRILASDVVVVNHTLFFTLLSGVEEQMDEGILFKNDFVIFDEAHTVETVAAQHIGLNLSNGQIRYALNRLWNPKTKKGLLAVLRRGRAMQLVSDLMDEAVQFFDAVEEACQEMVESGWDKKPIPGGSQFGGAQRARTWGVVRIRRADLVPDNITLPIQRLREELSELIKVTDDKETGQELLEFNRRLGALRDGVAQFLSQSLEEHVYWVDRSGKTSQIITLNAAPVDVAAYLRRRLFETRSSVIMTSATLGTRAPKPAPTVGEEPALPDRGTKQRGGGNQANPLGYFTSRVGASREPALQVGSPFDYRTQMKICVAGKMPEPTAPGYRDSLIQWIEHFTTLTGGKAFVLFTNTRLMQEIAARMDRFFSKLGVSCFVQGTGTPRSLMLEKFKAEQDSVLFGTDSFWQGVDVPGEALTNVILTRLPFAVPDHPLIEARIEQIESRGGNAFSEFSLPEAVLRFRQGVGRLIRTKTDHGIVVVLDNRILTKRYGRVFIDALPECPFEIV
jgi:ATP-dependent DNA helicase DinG